MIDNCERIPINNITKLNKINNKKEPAEKNKRQINECDEIYRSILAKRLAPEKPVI